jgi:hypothetical protein
MMSNGIDADQVSENHRLTLEALDDVDAGRTIDHQLLIAWSDSLNTDSPLPPPRITPPA